MPSYPAPFRHDAFAAVPLVVPPRRPARTNRVLDVAPEIGNTASFPSPKLCRALTITVASTTSAHESVSHGNVDPKGPDPAAKHFQLVPGVDPAEVRFTASNPQNAKLVRFELWSARIPEGPIWTREYTAAASIVLAAGSFDFDEVTVSDGRFLGGVPDVLHAPYQLRMTVECAATGARNTAWTHFDVLVHEIALHYGPEAMIPTSDIADVSPTNRARTLADERELVQALQAQGTEVPEDGEIPVVLPSTQAAYINFMEWYCRRDYAYLRHKSRWGQGPRIPLVARVSLRRVDGSGVHSAQAGLALGGAKFLWDWRDRTAAERGVELDGLHAHATARTYIFAGLRYKENAADEPHDCLNAHAERGGKRGGPAQTFPTAGLRGFPFTVTPALTRRWASISTAEARGANACCTGVVFQPSRMALDSYRVRVFLHAPTLDAPDPQADLLRAHPGLPTAETGFFAVRRRIDARYITKGPSTTPMDLSVIDRAYAVGGVLIEWTRETWDMREHRRYFAEALQADNFNESLAEVRGQRHPKGIVGRQRKIRAYVASRGGVHVRAYDHWSGTDARYPQVTASEANFTLPGRAPASRPFIAQATRNFIDKPRRINGVLSAWNRFTAANRGLTGDVALVRFCETGLSQSRRNKVMAAARLLYEAAGWTGWDAAADDEHAWAKENYFYTKGLNEINIEMHQRKIMNDGFLGATFFHYTHFYEVMGERGGRTEVTARQCDIGGLASVGYSADLGLRSAFVVWDHPTNGQRRLLAARLSGQEPEPMKNGNWTSAHEFGHFFHLPHATPTGGGSECAMHDASDLKCVMNYDPDSEHLCGGCALRIAGWARFKVEGMEGVGRADAGAAGSAPFEFTHDDVRDAVLSVTTELL